MRNRLLILNLILLAALLLHPPLIQAQEALPSDYSGYYMLSNQGGLNTFPEIAFLILFKNNNPKQESTLRPVEGPILEGELRVKQKNSEQPLHYNVKTKSINKNTLTFSTEILHGVHYEFKGKFHEFGNFQQSPPTGDILTGNLIKKRGSKVVSESKVNFTYFEGD